MRKVPDSGAPATRAALMVPVKHEGRVVGVVQVMSDQQRVLGRAARARRGAGRADGRRGAERAAARGARAGCEAAEAAARAVAAEREQAANVLEAVGDGIFLVDGAGIVRFWNRAAEARDRA